MPDEADSLRIVLPDGRVITGKDGVHWMPDEADSLRIVLPDGRVITGKDGVHWMPEQPDPVNHPPHYTQGGIECIDAIEAALTPEEFRGYCKGNALKYVWRERHKGGDESLAKARWYLSKLNGGKTCATE